MPTRRSCCTTYLLGFVTSLLFLTLNSNKPVQAYVYDFSIQLTKQKTLRALKGAQELLRLIDTKHQRFLQLGEPYATIGVQMTVRSNLSIRSKYLQFETTLRKVGYKKTGPNPFAVWRREWQAVLYAWEALEKKVVGKSSAAYDREYKALIKKPSTPQTRRRQEQLVHLAQLCAVSQQNAKATSSILPKLQKFKSRILQQTKPKPPPRSTPKTNKKP